VQRPALIFDGDCAFCGRCASVARRLLPTGSAVLPWQQVDLESIGLTAERARSEVLWIDRDGGVSGGAEAVARALRASGGFWALLGFVLSVPPIRWLTPPIYRLVAANRYRLPGGTAACRVPPPRDEVSDGAA
jgi:predicted DCC family thiol-disulfide oxidoreductase YuxK